MEDMLLDDQRIEGKNPRNRLKKQAKILALQIIFLSAFNTVLYLFFVPDSALPAFENVILVFMVGINLLGLILGLLLGLIPYKNLKYSQRYLRAGLISMLTLQAIFAGGLLVLTGISVVQNV